MQREEQVGHGLHNFPAGLNASNHQLRDMDIGQGEENIKQAGPA